MPAASRVSARCRRISRCSARSRASRSASSTDRAARRPSGPSGSNPSTQVASRFPRSRVGSAQTAPIALTVLAQPAGAQGKPGDDVFLEVTAEPLDAVRAAAGALHGEALFLVRAHRRKSQRAAGRRHRRAAARSGQELSRDGRRSPLSRDGTSLRADAGEERRARTARARVPRQRARRRRSDRILQPPAHDQRALRCGAAAGASRNRRHGRAIRGCRRNRCC